MLTLFPPVLVLFPPVFVPFPPVLVLFPPVLTRFATFPPFDGVVFPAVFGGIAAAVLPFFAGLGVDWRPS